MGIHYPQTMHLSRYEAMTERRYRLLALITEGDRRSDSELAVAAGVSCRTAQRYLSHFAKQGRVVSRRQRYHHGAFGWCNERLLFVVPDDEFAVAPDPIEPPDADEVPSSLESNPFFASLLAGMDVVIEEPQASLEVSPTPQDDFVVPPGTPEWPCPTEAEKLEGMRKHIATVRARYAFRNADWDKIDTYTEEGSKQSLLAAISILDAHAPVVAAEQDAKEAAEAAERRRMRYAAPFQTERYKRAYELAQQGHNMLELMKSL